MIEQMAKSAGRKALSKSLKFLADVFAVAISIPWAAPLGDAKGRIAVEETRVVTGAQWASAFAWISLIPAGYFYLAIRLNSEAFGPLPPNSAIWLLLAIVPYGLYIFGRRFSAAKGRHARVRDIKTAMYELVLGPTPDPFGAPGTRLPFNPWWPTFWVGVSMGFLAIVLALSTLWAPFFASFWPPLVPWAAAWYPAMTMASITVFAALAGSAGAVFAKDEDLLRNQKARGSYEYAKFLGISLADFESSGGDWIVSPDGERVTITPLPIAARKNTVADLEASAEKFLPAWTIESMTADEVVIVKVTDGSEVGAARIAKAASGGLIRGFFNEKNTPTRPDHVRWSINPEHKGGKPDEVDAFARTQEHGVRLVEWDPVGRLAFLARIPPKTLAIRDRTAVVLGCAAWDVELTLSTTSERREHGFAEQVEILRAPFASRDTDKRKAFWLEQLPAIIGTPDGHIWKFSENPKTGGITLTCVVDPLRELIPYSADPSTQVAPTEPWLVGRDETGTDVTIDLASSAHMLIAGATRSGKSVCTYSLITHVLRMGPSARLLVADPNDTTVAPFELLVSWSTSDTNPEPVTEMLQWVRAEMDRRKPILREMRQDKVSEFTPEMPLLVIVIDEAANFMKHADKVAAAEMTNELLAVVSQGAKYGVRLVLITQRPDSTILPTAVRSQLSARISFRVEALEDAKMSFPDIEDPAELLGFAPGVGLVKEVGGQPRRFRSEFLEDHWAAADRVAQALPRVDVKNLGPAAAVAEPVITTVGSFEFSLDDLDDLNDDPSEPSPTPALSTSYDFTL